MSRYMVSAAPALGKAGMIADNLPAEVISKVANGAVRVGYGVVYAGIANASSNGLHPGDCMMPGAIGASTNSLVTTTATAATVVTPTLQAAAARITPARQVTFTLNSHANWDATTGTIEGYDAEGEFVSEQFSIPDGGNTTITTDNKFGSVSSISIPAQSGTGGSFTVGTAASEAEYSGEFLGIAMYDSSREPYGSTNNDYADGEMVPVVTKGRVWVYTEAAVVEGQQVFIRTVTASTDIPGQFSGAPGAGFSQLDRAVWASSANADGLAILWLK